MHFIKPVYVVQPFNAMTAVILVLVTALVGFVTGAVFGAIWNWIARSRTNS
jgi:MFS superfamily sulfate permease-like transporter